MIIVVEATGVRVDSPDDLKRFHLEALAGADVDEALRQSGFGHLADGGDDAMVSVAAVRAAVAGRVEPASWDPAFEGMLGYARSKGWLDETGTLIRAHIERP